MRLITLLLAGLMLTSAGRAEQKEKPGRPRIGLALAGGSALGLSHIGVLQWLEENRIPIDFIAGTSMGGLVAGLHASGMTATEMTEFVQKVNWQLALASSTPYKDLAFRRKEDAAQYPVAFELGIKNRRLNLPPGLSPGEGVSLVLSRFTAPYGGMSSFDDLPTPFRCVASDLVSGKGVVFDRGSMFDALRATMSLPALFAPVRKDGMVLVDGGLTNNLPVDVVRSMGADVVIAVALDVPTNERDFESLLGIASRSVSYMIMENERPNIAAADVVLMPLLKGMTGADYGKWQEFRKLGYEAARIKAGQLRALQVDESVYAEHLAARQARRRPSSIRPTQVLVEGDVAPKLKEAVIASLTPPAGAVLDPSKLEEQMWKLTGVGRFETATYEFKRAEGHETLVVNVREKKYGPPLLRPSIFLDGANGEGFRFGAAARLTFLDAGGPASEWRTDLSVGTFNRLQSEYYYRIGGGKWFLAPRGGLVQDPLPVYGRGGVRLAEFTEKNYFGALDVGYAFGRRQELRIGYSSGYLKTRLNTGMLDPAPLSGRYGAAHLTLRHDSRDNPIIPARGSLASARVSWFDRYPLVSGTFAAFEGSLSHAHPIRPSYTLISQLRAAGTAQETGLSTMYRLGGLSNMSALGRHQLIGNRLYYGNVSLLRTLSRSLAPAVSVHALIGYESGRAWFAGESARPRHGGLFGLAASTPLGALFVGSGIGDQGDRKILFRLGHLF